MGQLGSLRCIVALITLLALGPVSLFPVATVFAQNAGPGAGLMEESSYVSPQFGYSVTWESPWTADPRLTTSVADRYDTLRLDARAAALQLFGAPAAGATPAEAIDVAIDLQREDDPATTIVTQSADETVARALVEFSRARAGGEPVALRASYEARVLPGSGAGETGGDALVLVSLTAPVAIWDRAIEIAGLVSVNDQPVLSNGQAAGTGASPTPLAPPPPPGTTPPAFELTPVASPTASEAATTPNDRDQLLPTAPTTTLATATAEPAGAPATATRRDLQIGGERDTPLGEGVVGDTYTSPSFGYSVAWDGAIWSVEDEQSERGQDLLRIGTPLSTLYFEAYDGFAGDPAACLEAAAAELSAETGVSDFAVATDRNGDPLTGADATSAYAVYTLTFTPDTGEALAFADYIECRELVPGEAVLEITLIVGLDVYNEQVALMQDVLDTLQPLPTGQPSGAAATSAAPTALAGERDAQLPPQATDPTPATDAGAEAESGVDGTTFTSPRFGYSLRWDDTWTVEEEVIEDDAELLQLSNGVSVVDIQAFIEEFGDDPTACLDFVAGQLEVDPAIQDLMVVTDANGLPLRGGDATSAFAVYSYTGARDGGAVEPLARFVRCQLLTLEGVVLVFSQTVPPEAYDDQIAARRALLDSLDE